MIYIAQLVGMGLGGLIATFIIHCIIVFGMMEYRKHYLITFENKLERLLPDDLMVIGFIAFILFGLGSFFFALISLGKDESDFMIWFAVGCGLYCQIPLWKTWFPSMFTQMFPGRKTR